MQLYLISQEQRLAIEHNFGRLRLGPTYEDCASYTDISRWQTAWQLRRKCVVEQGYGHAPPLPAKYYVKGILQAFGNMRLLTKKGSRRDKLSSGVPYRAGCSHWLFGSSTPWGLAQAGKLTLSTATENVGCCGLRRAFGISRELPSRPGVSMRKIFSLLADLFALDRIVERMVGVATWPV